MKTIKQVADEIGISKQKLYRYIKANHINEVHHDEGIIYIDETLETLLKQHFSADEVHRDTSQSVSSDTVLIQSLESQIEFLKEQLREKDKQISENQESLKREQVLRLQANQRIEFLEQKEQNQEQKEEKEEEKEVYKKTFFGLYKRVK